MKIRFLLDENLMTRPVIKAALRFDTTIDIIRVGGEGAPPLGTLDPEILLFCEAERRLLVTRNRKSMAGHIADHHAAGRHHWGVFKLARKLSIGELAEELYLYWAASEAEEWIDRVEWIP